MPAYPNRPTSPYRSTLAYTTGPVPPRSQQRQFLPNDMSRPVAGNPYQLVGSRPRVADGPFAGGNNIGLNGDAVGETMIERFERERNGRLGLRPSSFGLPPESDQFSYPPAPEVNMPTASAAVDMSQYVPGLRSHEIQRHEHLRPAPADGYAPASAIDPSNEWPVSALDIANPHVRFGRQLPNPGSVAAPNHSALGQSSVGARVPQQIPGLPPAPSYQRPQLSQRPFGQPIDLTRPPEHQELQHQFVTRMPDQRQFLANMHTFDEMARARVKLTNRNLEQLGAVGRANPGPFEDRGLTPQQAAYVDNDLPQSPLTNTRFVGRMAETPRDLSGKNGVRYAVNYRGDQFAYIPKYQSDGDVDRSDFVEGTERTGSYGTMRVERNPLTGGIALIGGGRPIRDENVEGQESGPYASRQELYARQQARSQAYKDTRAQRAYSRNPRLANAPAVADMRDRRSDVEYERTKTRRRDAMLEQVQMEALKQQLKGMTPEQLSAFLGEMKDRPSRSGGSLPTPKEAKDYRKKKNQEKNREVFDRANDGSGYGFGSY